MAVSGEPILSRIDRTDCMLKQLEDIRGGAGDVHHISIAKSSASSEPSTPSSGTGGASSSSDFSPRSLQKHCRPINSAIMEAVSKGTLIERLDHIEGRLTKMEDETEAPRQKDDQKVMIENSEKKVQRNNNKKKKKKKKKGLKEIVKKLVK